MDLFVDRKWEVMGKVYAVALTDSRHHVGHQLGSDVPLSAWIKHHCQEWVTSTKPLDRSATTVLKKVSNGFCWYRRTRLSHFL